MTITNGESLKLLLWPSQRFWMISECQKRRGELFARLSYVISFTSIAENFFFYSLYLKVRNQKSFFQFAQNQVKVATDGSFCADTTFVQTPLKIFVFTLRLCSRYLKGTPELALYASKKIGTIRCTNRILGVSNHGQMAS